MLALSFKQPYGWLLLHGNKDFENRPKFTSFRGNVLLHVTKEPYVNIDLVRMDVRRHFKINVPEELDYGGIIGVIRLAPFVSEFKSKWAFSGGYPVEATQVLPFTPWKGKQGFWKFPLDRYIRLLNQAGVDNPNQEEFYNGWMVPGYFAFQGPL